MNAWLQLMKRVILTGMYQTLDVDLWLFLHIFKTVCDVDCNNALFQCGSPNGVHNFDQIFILLCQIFEECFYLIQRMLHCEESECIYMFTEYCRNFDTRVHQQYVLCAPSYLIYNEQIYNYYVAMYTYTLPLLNKWYM